MQQAVPYPGILCFDRTPPKGAVSPSGTVNGTITLGTSPTDNDQVAGVQYKIDGSAIGSEVTSAPWQTTHDTHLLTNGAHTYSAVIRDRVGNTTTVSQGVTVSNTAPSSGQLTFDEWQGSDGEGGYSGGRTIGPDFDHRQSADYIWSAHGDKSSRPLPSNPDSTHYQMRVQMGVSVTGRIEGGSDGNVIHVYMDVAGTEYDSWANGNESTPSLDGPQVNVNGGEQINFYKWETSSGTNTSFTQGVIAFYDFVPKSPYLS